jgi:hypothetical protein
VIILWLFVVEAAVHRVLPFTALSSERSSERLSVLHSMPLFPSRFLLPNVGYFGQRQSLLDFASSFSGSRYSLSLYKPPLFRLD